MRKYLAYSSIWISLSAYILSVASLAYIHRLHAFLRPQALLILGSTLFIYSLHNWVKRKKNVQTTRNSWNKAHPKSIVLLGSLGACIMAYSAFHLPFKFWIPYIFLFIASLGYSYPLLVKNHIRRNIKSYGLLKPFYLAFVWWATTYFIPLYSNTNYLSPSELIDGIYRLVLCVILCMLFDSKDMETDSQSGIYTWAWYWKDSLFSKLINIIFVLQFLCFVVYCITFDSLLILLFFFNLWVQFNIRNAAKQKDELFYLWNIDGILLLYGLIILIYNLLKI